MSQRISLKNHVGFAVLLFTVSCGSQTPVATPPAAPHSAAQVLSDHPASKPFVISEASLPDGFPAPGAVDVLMIKHYPACREARVDSPDGSDDDMFMSLFRHIQSNDIPMTSPVEITYAQPAGTQPAKPVAMAFVYRTQTTGKPGADGKVRVIDLPAQTVISIGVRGGYNAGNFQSALDKINAFVKTASDKYTPAGPPRYLGYNSPFVPPFMRFGEVQLPVTVKSTAN